VFFSLLLSFIISVITLLLVVCIIFVFFSYSNDYSYEVKQAGYISLGVGTMFFIFMAICGGNAAVSRYLEKDKARIHDTKFLAYVSISLL